MHPTANRTSPEVPREETFSTKDRGKEVQAQRRGWRRGDEGEMVWRECRSGGKPSAMNVTSIHWAPDSVPGQKEAEDVEGWTDSGKRKV